MSTHTTYFCDVCNLDRDIREGDDEGHAINYSEYPVGDGWAEFTKQRSTYGYDEMHVCAHCLADPDLDLWDGYEIADFDTASRKNYEKGRAHAEAYSAAVESLADGDRWRGFRVRQVFGDYPYGYRPGPKMEDGFFSADERERRQRYEREREEHALAIASSEEERTS